MADFLLTCDEAARMLAVRPSTIRAWTATRKIPPFRIGAKAIRYRRADLENFIRAGGRPAEAGTR